MTARDPTTPWTTAVRMLICGFFVLLPVSLLCLVLAEMLDLAVAVATPLTLLFPEGLLDDAKVPAILAAVLIATTSLAIGLLMKCRWGRRAESWLERRLLSPVPGYGFLKVLARSLGGMAEANTLRAALRHLPDGSRRAVYLVEEPNGGLCTILVPHAPAAMSGPVELVPRDSLSKLDRGLGSFMQALNHWGTGLAQLPEVSGLEVTSRRKEP